MAVKDPLISIQEALDKSIEETNLTNTMLEAQKLHQVSQKNLSELTPIADARARVDTALMILLETKKVIAELQKYQEDHQT